MRLNLSDAPLAILWAAYVVLLAGGIGGHVLYGGTPANMAWTAPAFLTLAVAIAFFSVPSWWRPLALAGVIGFAAEVLGVHTGFPFGPYQYTSALRPLVFGVPPVVAGAWIVLFSYVSQMRLHPLASALCMVALDLVIDPLASGELDYWRWQATGPYFGIPLLNFAGWFAVSACIFYGLRTPAPRSPSIHMLGRTIVFFFAAISAAHHSLVPAFLGVALTYLGYRRFRWLKTYSPDMS